MYKTLTTLLASNILFDFIIQAIIVERNLHTYYRLPTATVKTLNASEDYFILQCPFKSSMIIPKPKEMPVCLIVGRYSENKDKQQDLIKAKPRTALNTQVDYRHLKPPHSFVKLVKMKDGKPYTLLLKPIGKKELLFKKATTLLKKPYKSHLTNPKTTLVNQTTVLYSVPLIQKIQINDSLALSSAKELKKSLAPPKSLTSLPADNLFDDLSDEDITQPGPLKYLAVQAALNKLQQFPKKLLRQPAAMNRTEYKSEKFFADSESHKKGYRTKGFQNMYHRDEIYQDHIFYDDLQQLGNYRIKEKLQQKQP